METPLATTEMEVVVTDENGNQDSYTVARHADVVRSLEAALDSALLKVVFGNDPVAADCSFDEVGIQAGAHLAVVRWPKVELLVFPTFLYDDPRVLTVDKHTVTKAVDEVLRDRNARRDAFVMFEMIRLHTTPCAEELGLPWEYDQWEDGANGEEAPDAYHRRDRRRWEDEHSVLVNEAGSVIGMPVNEYFQGIPTRSGHLLRGPVVMQRFLQEPGCGDTVSLPVDAAVLAERGLPDPRLQRTATLR